MNIDYEKNILNFYKKNETNNIQNSMDVQQFIKPIFRNSNKFLNELTNNEIIYIEQKTSKYLKNKYKTYKKS